MPESKWQTIDTAPTDGTEFLGLWSNGDMHVVYIRKGLCCRPMEGDAWMKPRLWMPLPELPAEDDDHA